MHANLYLQAGMGSTVLAVSLLKRTVGSFSSILVYISTAGIEATIFLIRYLSLDLVMSVPVFFFLNL